MEFYIYEGESAGSAHGFEVVDKHSDESDSAESAHGIEVVYVDPSIDRLLKPTVPIIKDIIATCKCHQNWEECKDQIVELCLEADIAYKRQILPHMCGIHPTSPVDAIQAHRLALKVSRSGYSERQLGTPIVFEKAGPRASAASAQEEFMEKNFQMSNGYLKKMAYSDVSYLPVKGSHLFAAANIVQAGNECRGLHEQMSTDGYIDQAKTLQLCPSWNKPLTDGILSS